MRVAVVGCGRMGQLHIRTLTKLGHEVVTIDSDPSRAEYRTLEEAPHCDAACIAVPREALAPQARSALRRGMNVLVEKPFANNVHNGRDLVALAEENGLTLGVGYTERANAGVQTLKGSLEHVGAIRSIEIHRLGPAPAHPRNVIYDLATHDIDVLRYLGFSPRLIEMEGSGRTATLNLWLGGSFATINVSNEHPAKRRTLTVVGSDGHLELDYQAQTLALITDDGATSLNHMVSIPLMHEWTNFLNGAPLATGYDGLAVLEVLRGRCCDGGCGPVYRSPDHEREGYQSTDADHNRN
jgi:UDP-N-acetylglucosamine 3-dehydrogenase